MVSRQPQRWERGPEMGLKASASPNTFMSISKPRWEHPDQVSRMGTPKSALVLPKGVRGRRKKHTLPTCCVCSRVIPPKMRSCLKAEECQCAPGAAANGGRGGKPSCLCLTTAPGLRAEVRMLQIPTAAVCLQDLRNQTKQLKRNPVV